MKIRQAKAVYAAIALAVLALTGCTKSASDTGEALTFGIDATYAPNEFKDAQGNLVGWDVELGQAIADKMGREAVFTVATFDNIIPGVVGGKYDVGLSSFSDTPERQKQVDFVNYYSDGTQWAASGDAQVDPENACGLTVAVQTGTTQADELPVKSAACTDAGLPAIKILSFDSQDTATQAALSGRADAMTADSPITQYAVKQSEGKLTLIGAPYDVVNYGLAVQKGNDDLTAQLQEALQALVEDGTYMSILEKWGVEAGAVSNITINGK